MNKMIMTFAGLLLMPDAGWPQATSPLEKYRNLEYPPKDENFAKGWQERLLLGIRFSWPGHPAWSEGRVGGG